MDVLHLVVDCQTSSSIWRTLEQAIASSSNSRIMQLHASFQDLRQGDESVTQFMQKSKALFDELGAAGQPISREDFNLYVFRGLWGESLQDFTVLPTNIFRRCVISSPSVIYLPTSSSTDYVRQLSFRR
jgi:hypothetical protein